MTQCYFEDGNLDTSVYLWEDLSSDHSIQGPAIIIDKNRWVISWKFLNTTLYIVISSACHSFFWQQLWCISLQTRPV